MNPPAPALVLGGGNALGAYHAGAWRSLEEAGVTPGWIVGTSIGALMAAIIVGNGPGERTAALQRFWNRASAFDATAMLPPAVRQPLQYVQALSSRLLGRPPLFSLRPPDLTGSDPTPGQFDAGPMRRLLAELVDTDRLNSGDIRLTVLATDLATGQEAAFDTRHQPVTLDHIMASAALIPDFPPVTIDGRLMVDGGLTANCPVHLVLDEAWRDGLAVPLSVFAVDLFPAAAPLPRGLLQAAQRQSDLIFACQTVQSLQARTMAWHGRDPGAAVFYRAYEALQEETALKGFDFSAGTLARRQDAGARDMADAITQWRSMTGQPGLSVHQRPAV